MLNVGSTGTYADAFWPLLVRTDPEEVLRYRAKQKAYLARYGRQSWFAWEHREVSELDEAYAAIAELMEQENAFGQEDR